MGEYLSGILIEASEMYLRRQIEMASLDGTKQYQSVIMIRVHYEFVTGLL